jgi:transposase
MSEHIDGIHRKQTILFSDTLDEYVDEENPVRFIDAFVDSLDLEKLGFKHSITCETGRPSYDPSDLLKLYVYGYLNQIRSSRKLEKECHRNLEVIWLMKKLASSLNPASSSSAILEATKFSENASNQHPSQNGRGGI